MFGLVHYRAIIEPLSPSVQSATVLLSDSPDQVLVLIKTKRSKLLLCLLRESFLYLQEPHYPGL